MSPALWQLGNTLAALVLFVFAITSLLTGAAIHTGEAVRLLLEQPLRRIRDESPSSRAVLADRSMLVAAACASFAALVELSILALVFAVIAYGSRGRVKRLVSSEHRLLALGTQLSADLSAGAIAPLVLVELLIGDFLMAAAIASVVVSLCWPTGGPGTRAGAWRPASLGI